MKPIYEPHIARIERLASEWEPRLDLPGITVIHRYFENFGGDNDSGIIAETEVHYVYRDAVIRWYMPAVVRLDDTDLEDCLVHEYVHVLIAPMELHIPEKFKGEQNEFAVENMARALLAVHRSKS